MNAKFTWTKKIVCILWKPHGDTEEFMICGEVGLGLSGGKKMVPAPLSRSAAVGSVRFFLALCQTAPPCGSDTPEPSCIASNGVSRTPNRNGSCSVARCLYPTQPLLGWAPGEGCTAMNRKGGSDRRGCMVRCINV